MAPIPVPVAPAAEPIRGADVEPIVVGDDDNEPIRGTPTAPITE